MQKDLSIDDIKIILESLNYTKRNFESNIYPFEGTKKDRISKVENIIMKLRYIKKERNSSSPY